MTTDRLLRVLNAVILPVLAIVAFMKVNERFTSWGEAAIANLVTFLLSFVYVIFALAPRRSARSRLIADVGRAWILAFLIMVLVLAPFISLIVLRHETGNVTLTHDHPLQIEAAVDFLLRGENPYEADYRPALLAWGDNNPAFDHFISLPFEVLSAAPFSVASKALFGWYDQRFVHLAAFLLILVVLMFVARGTEARLLVTTLFVFNDFFLPTFIEGFNDVFVLSLLALAGFLLHRRSIGWASVVFGLALASKHYAVFFVPFFFFYLLETVAPGQPIRVRFQRAVRWSLPAVAVAVLLIAPFFVWNPQAFIDDTIRYPAGTISTSYPIMGFGFSKILLQSGLIAEQHEYFPFWMIQIPLIVALVSTFIWWLLKSPALSRVYIFGALVLFVYLYFSRFLHVNYPGVVFSLMILGLAFFTREEDLSNGYDS